MNRVLRLAAKRELAPELVKRIQIVAVQEVALYGVER